ncbi:MAG: hypothetical protein LBH80_07845 [Prevotellaceae bacterium]|jgi:cell division septum initiation protein DivIVA|nr:hypothetical protein [Prevotellaceae bacterium]
MKKILLTIGLAISLSAFAETPRSTTDEVQKDLQAVKTEMQSLRSKTSRLESEVTSLKAQLKKANEIIDGLKQTTQALEQSTEQNNKAIRETADRLGVKISTTEETANRRISKVGSNTILYIIIVFLLAIVLLGLVYWFLSKRQRETKEELEKDVLGNFGKVVDELIQKINEQPIPDSEIKPEKIDHSFFLKSAREIIVIERNLSLMDDKTKGKKQLERSLESLKDNLLAHGYKITPLLGKQFNEGMKVIVIESILDENMEPGDEIICKIIEPQVLYEGKMIQAAQVVLKVGPQKEDVPTENNEEINDDENL